MLAILFELVCTLVKGLALVLVLLELLGLEDVLAGAL